MSFKAFFCNIGPLSPKGFDPHRTWMEFLMSQNLFKVQHSTCFLSSVTLGILSCHRNDELLKGLVTHGNPLPDIIKQMLCGSHLRVHVTNESSMQVGQNQPPEKARCLLMCPQPRVPVIPGKGSLSGEVD